MASQSASIITQAAENCRSSLVKCKDINTLMVEEWAENRLADFNLWAAGIGVFAAERASLDSRLEPKPVVRNVVISLLLLLYKLILICIETASEPIHSENLPISSDDDNQSSFPRSNEQLGENMRNVDDVLNQLAQMAFAIRQSGTHIRLQKADRKNNPGSEKDLTAFRLHLTAIILVSTLSVAEVLELNGRIDNVNLSDIEERLILCNLKRRHRFLYAQAHATRLGKTKVPTKPTKLIPVPEQVISNARQVTVEDKTLSVKSKPTSQKFETQKASAVVEEPSIQTDTTATAMTSLIEPPIKKQSSNISATQVSSTVAKIRYPTITVPQSSLVFRCPCCCQTLPVMYTERSHWRKHLVGDLCPYTCILDKCPHPEQLYSSKEAWQKHMLEGHETQEYWECLACLSNERFDQEQDFVDHLLSLHKDTIEPSQVPALTEALKCSSPTEIGQCPLCPKSASSDQTQNSESSIDHIAEHVHDFALRALPWGPDEQLGGLDQKACKKSSDWLATLDEEREFLADIEDGTSRYSSKLEPDVAVRRQPSYFEHINNVYFDDKSVTPSIESDGSRDYQNDLTQEKISLLWNVPFNRNQNFSGREDELKILQTGILHSETQFSCVLYGSSGCGKTEIVRELAFRISEDHPSYSIFWVNASDYDTVQRDFIEIGRQLNIVKTQGGVGDEEMLDQEIHARALVSEHLSQEGSGSWLFILDNANQATAGFTAGSLAAKPNTSVVFTSQDPALSSTLILFHNVTEIDIAWDSFSVSPNLQKGDELVQETEGNMPSSEKTPVTERFNIPDVGMSLLWHTKDPAAHIVFLHGIEGHPYQSWAAPSRDRRRFAVYGDAVTRPLDESQKDDVFWPLDRVARDFPGCSIWTCGFAASVAELFRAPEFSLDLRPCSSKVLDAIASKVSNRSDEISKPIVFVVHNFGGLVIKQVLAWARDSGNPSEQALYSAVRGVLFLGSSHEALSTANLRDTVWNLVSQIYHNSELHEVRSICFKITGNQTQEIGLHLDFLSILQNKRMLAFNFHTEEVESHPTNRKKFSLNHRRARNEYIYTGDIEISKSIGVINKAYRQVRHALELALDTRPAAI